MRIRPAGCFPLMILLLGIAAYSNSFQGAFVLDDSRTITENLRIRRIMPVENGEWLSARSFADLTFALNYAGGGLNPADYHAVNLVIHLLAALLLYGVVGRTLELTARPPAPAVECPIRKTPHWPSFPLRSGQYIPLRRQVSPI